jgi:hypothetical protein
LLVLGSVYSTAQVQITEFMAANTRTWMDQDREYSDWIEIGNLGSEAVNLGGWFLTDDPARPRQWAFPSTNLDPGAYLVVFASGKNRAVAGGQLHTNFKLSAEGEFLALVRPDGVTVASAFTPAFPVQSADVSYGVFGGTQYFFQKPSAGTSNTVGAVARVTDTKFSHDRGFYTTPFSLTLSCATEGAEIRYTTNGAPPTATSGLVYTNPIAVPGTKIVRAAAFRAGYIPANVDTQTYLFVDDILRQATNGVAPPGWPSSWGQNVVDYGMDPEVVNDPRYRDGIREDLKSLPTFSLVTELRHLFDASTGIYANPSGDEIAWERPASFELIQADGSQGFHVNCGLRIRGGFSRSPSNPKHAFRLFFRAEYGASQLRFPLFGEQGADVFEKIDLRTAQNYSWSFQGDSRCTFLRDQLSRDAQLAMGRPATRGRFYHLYINGLYWGLYNTEERADAAYGATYFGGREEAYDTIKVDPDLNYVIEATDGTQAAWTRLWRAATNGFATDIAYQQVQGNNPDGTRNFAYENLLDVPNLVDYMLVILFGGNLDAPISNFLGNASPNNFFAVRGTNGMAGFRFFAHDSEHTLLNLNEDRTGPYAAGDPTRGSNLTKSNPQYFWQRLQSNAEFRVLVGDHVHRHCFNGGPLSPEGLMASFSARSNEIRRAMVCESARWGDAKSGTPFTRDSHWVPAMNEIASYLRNRPAVLVQQMRADSLYPAVVAPSFNRHGGNIDPGFTLTMAAPAGVIYYTLDGTDPRLRGGAVSLAARVYSGPIPVLESTQVRARVLAAGAWSALNEAPFTVVRTYRDLLITEIMFHPPDDGLVVGEDLEFLELKNVGSTELDLSGVQFTQGVTFRFQNGTRLAPGKFLVLSSNSDAFRSRYPGVELAGTYLGHLANGGERLSLVHAAGAPIFSVAYGDGSSWPIAADGLGFSLVPADPDRNPVPDQPGAWRASARLGGSPGTDDPQVVAEPLIVTEVLTHTDLPQVDSVEIYNPTDQDVDIGHWYLTDDRAAPAKYSIPAGTVVPARGYRVFDERDFNADTNAPTSFLFDSHGEEVFLFSADASGVLTGYSHGFGFPSAANGVSFGRTTNSVGDIHYTPQVSNSFGAANSGPRFGPLVIEEIHYAPSPGDVEFIELRNPTASPVALYDPEFPTNTWKLEGVGYSFPTGMVFAPGGLVVVCGADPGAFRSRHGIPASVPVLGPWSGSLQDNGERVELLRPDSPDIGTNGVVFVPYLLVDWVRYDNRAPWPTNAAGLGSSIERLRSDAYGDDPAHWRASPGVPSPGYDNHGNRRPSVFMPADLTREAAAFPIAATVAAVVFDDGLPADPGGLELRWSTASGPAPVVFDAPQAARTEAWFPGVGTYVLRLTASDGEWQASGEVTVTLGRPPEQVTFIPAGSVWRYLDNGTDQGTAWRRAEFNDAGWSAGPAQLGYSSNPAEGDEATTLGYGPNSSSKYITYYFRTKFVVPDARAVASMAVRLLRDDGGVVYLNTNEVFRSNMPTGVIDYQTVASAAVGGDDETVVFYAGDVDPSYLVSGTNTLAVEIHQSGVASSDLSFDLELQGTRTSGVDAPPLVSAGPDFAIDNPGSVTLNGSVRDDGLPASPGAFTNLWSLVSGPASPQFSDARQYRTVATFPLPGSYVLRLSAGDGASTISDEVTVRVLGDAYEDWRRGHFSAEELLDAGISGEGADPDQDGQSNRNEYQSGTLPRDSRSVLRLHVVGRNTAGDRLTVGFEAVAGRSYSVVWTGAPSEGVVVRFLDIAAGPAHRTEHFQIPLENVSAARYFKVLTPSLP